MTMIWSELAKKTLKLDSKKPKALGKLSAAFMNPEGGQIIAYLIGFGRVLSPVDIQQITEDSILLKSLDVFVAPTDLFRLQDYGLRRCLLNQKKVRSKKGKSFGRVLDFEIDPVSGKVKKIFVTKSFFGIKWDERVFTWANILEVTDSAIILKLEPEVRIRRKGHVVAPNPS